MSQNHKSPIEVQGIAIAILSTNDSDFVSLPDMLNAKDGDFLITDWLRNRNTVEFLEIRESINALDFNYGDFPAIRSQAGLNNHKTSVTKWEEKTRERPFLEVRGRSFPPKGRPGLTGGANARHIEPRCTRATACGRDAFALRLRLKEKLINNASDCP